MQTNHKDAYIEDSIKKLLTDLKNKSISIDLASFLADHILFNIEEKAKHSTHQETI